MINYNFKSKILKVNKFNIKTNGIQLIENDDNVEIRVDVFRSQPVFLFKDSNKIIHVFDHMEYFYKNEIIPKEIDEIGFWEIMLFGNSLWTRTLYNNLFQLPSASSLLIDKQTLCFSINRYWDFNVYEDKSILNIDFAAQKLNEKLNELALKLEPNKDYILGLSGGMDSRITLGYLSKHLKRENIKTFTYAHTKTSLEYNYSKEICDRLNLKEPDFHLLDSSSYLNALGYMPKKSGGQIGINHCHIIDYLSRSKIGSQTYVSTYFSDAVFGWECESELTVEEKLMNPFLSKLSDITFLNDNIKKRIKKDAHFLTKDYDINSNISSLREYIYISERNQKFHNYLFSIQTDYVNDAKCFYHDYDLFTYSLSIPIRFRSRKKLEYFIVNKYFNEICSSKIGDISSNYFRPKNEIKSVTKYLKFKFLNRLNALLRVITQGNIQIDNIFQTEELERNLYKFFKKDLNKSFDYFYKKGLFDKRHAFLKKLPIKSTGVNERYRIISLATLFK